MQSFGVQEAGRHRYGTGRFLFGSLRNGLVTTTFKEWFHTNHIVRQSLLMGSLLADPDQVCLWWTHRCSHRDEPIYLDQQSR
jgi:hypothetical protein